MAEYIEREAVNALIKAECSPKVAAYLIDAVATVPAADVVPVVRCKDCEYWVTSEEAPCDTGCFLCGMYGGFPSADFFCASGVRKDGDGE